MHGPPDQSMGRGMLLFAGLVTILALWMSLGRGDWDQAALWYALAIFFACYGALLTGAGERWHRPLLGLGLIAGLIAFVWALRMVGVRLW
jgi:hypothetical protein